MHKSQRYAFRTHNRVTVFEVTTTVARRRRARSPNKIREDCSAEDEQRESPQRNVYRTSGCVTIHAATVRSLRGD
jgi:hypothetical protein